MVPAKIKGISRKRSAKQFADFKYFAYHNTSVGMQCEKNKRLKAFNNRWVQRSNSFISKLNSFVELITNVS
jgi:hypothetical protein